MLRGAELCRDARYRWFAAVKDDSTVKRSVSTYTRTNSRGRYTGRLGYITATPEETAVTERPVTKLWIRRLKTNPKRDRQF